MGDYSRPDEVTRSKQQRDWLVSQGIDYSEANRSMFGGTGVAPKDSAEVTEYVMPSQEDVNAFSLARQVQDDSRQEELPEIQDDTWYGKVLKAADFAQNVGLDGLAGMRQAKRNVQQDLSDKQTRAIADVKEGLGTALNVGLGLADPFIRSQQALFDWLAGEGGSEVIVDNLFNPYLLDAETNELYITTPWLTTMEFLWGKVSGAEDLADEEHLKRVNELYARANIKEFSEVVDAWAGGASPLAQDPDGTKAAVGSLRMDEFYRQLNDAGVAGKIGMGALATLYAGGEIFVDPLFMAADLPVIGVHALRKALPTGVRAAATARVAQRIQTLDKAQDAVRASSDHVEATLRAHNKNPTMDSAQEIKKATYNHSKNLLHLDNMKDPGPFEQIIYGYGYRRAPDAVELTRRTPLIEEVTPLSPTRGVRQDRVLSDLQAQVDELVKAEGLPSKMNPDAKVRYKELDKIRKKVRKMDEDDIPDVITVRGEQIQTKTAQELADELHAQRLQSLADEYPPIFDYGKPEIPFENQAQRAVDIDSGEDAGDALRIIVNGGEVDDASMATMSMTGRMNASSSMTMGVTKDGLIDMPQVQKTLKKWNMTRKKLDTQMEIKFDESAIPSPTMGERLKAFYAAAPDVFAKALYPNSTRFRFPGFMKGLIFPLREPQRIIEGMDPGAWGIWRNALRGMEGEVNRFNNLFHRELERFGAMTTGKAPRVQALVMERDPVSYNVNADKSEQLFQLLNVAEDSDEFAKLADGLTPDEVDAVKNIRQVLDFAADKQGLTNSDKYLEGYISHMFDRKLYNKGATPPEMRGLSPQSSVFVAHLLDRTGNAGFRPDAVAALDVYTRSMGRKLWVEPALNQIRAGAETVSKQRGNMWYNTYVDDFTAMVNGQRSFLGTKADRFLGDMAASSGPVTIPGGKNMRFNYSAGGLSRKLGAVTGLLYSSLLSGNLRYPIMSIATALNTTGAKYGMYRTLRGLFTSATGEGQALVNGLGIRKQWGQILEADGTVQKLTEKITKLRFPGRPSVQDTEAFIRGMTMQGAIDDIATKFGYSKIEDLYNSPHRNRAMMEAIRTTEEVNHFFGAGSRPPVFDRISRSMGRMATQFLSFTPKQSEQLWALYKDNPGYIMRYLGLAGWLQRMAAEDLGVDISEYVGFGFRPQGFEDITSPGVELMWGFARWNGAVNEYLFGDGNLDEVDQRTMELMRASENMVPLKVGIEQTAKQAEAVQTGQQLTQTGQLTRELDLTFGRKGQRGDIASTILQLKSIQGKATQEARERVGKLEKDYLFETESLMRDFIEAVEKDEPEIFENAASALQARGLPIRLDATKLQRQIEAENIEWWLRELSENNQLLPNVIQIMREEGLLPVMRLPEEGSP